MNVIADFNVQIYGKNVYRVWVRGFEVRKPIKRDVVCFFGIELLSSKTKIGSLNFYAVEIFNFVSAE